MTAAPAAKIKSKMMINTMSPAFELFAAGCDATIAAADTCGDVGAMGAIGAAGVIGVETGFGVIVTAGGTIGDVCGAIGCAGAAGWTGCGAGVEAGCTGMAEGGVAGAGVSAANASPTSIAFHPPAANAFIRSFF